MSVLEANRQREHASPTQSDFRRAVKTVSGRIGSRIVDSSTEGFFSASFESIPPVVTGFANFAQVTFIAHGATVERRYPANDLDENGYSTDEVAFLLSLENAAGDEEAPEGEAEFLNWLHCD